MNWIIMGLGAALLLSLLRLWRCERQLKDWAEQLEETDENSNLRLGTSVRSRAFLRCCRAFFRPGTQQLDGVRSPVQKANRACTQYALFLLYTLHGLKQALT